MSKVVEHGVEVPMDFTEVRCLCVSVLMRSVRWWCLGWGCKERSMCGLCVEEGRGAEVRSRGTGCTAQG